MMLMAAPGYGFLNVLPLLNLFNGVASGLGMKLGGGVRHNNNYSFPEIVCRKCGATQSDQLGYLRIKNAWFPEQKKPERSLKCYYCEVCDLWINKKRAVKSITALEPLTPRAREKGHHDE
ncbi:hypothetical protein ES703_106984 [subsurface metagenome]